MFKIIESVFMGANLRSPTQLSAEAQRVILEELWPRRVVSSVWAAEMPRRDGKFELCLIFTQEPKWVDIADRDIFGNFPNYFVDLQKSLLANYPVVNLLILTPGDARCLWASPRNIPLVGKMKQWMPDRSEKLGQLAESLAAATSTTIYKPILSYNDRLFAGALGKQIYYPATSTYQAKKTPLTPNDFSQVKPRDFRPLSSLAVADLRAEFLSLKQIAGFRAAEIEMINGGRVLECFWTPVESATQFDYAQVNHTFGELVFGAGKNYDAILCQPYFGDLDDLEGSVESVAEGFSLSTIIGPEDRPRVKYLEYPDWFASNKEAAYAHGLNAQYPLNLSDDLEAAFDALLADNEHLTSAVLSARASYSGSLELFLVPAESFDAVVEAELNLGLEKIKANKELLAPYRMLLTNILRRPSQLRALPYSTEAATFRGEAHSAQGDGYFNGATYFNAETKAVLVNFLSSFDVLEAVLSSHQEYGRTVPDLYISHSSSYEKMRPALETLRAAQKNLSPSWASLQVTQNAERRLWPSAAFGQRLVGVPWPNVYTASLNVAAQLDPAKPGLSEEEEELAEQAWEIYLKFGPSV
jgi:hypothetical protein